MSKRKAKMPLFDHFGEFRVRLIRIIILLVISVCVFYVAAPSIANFLINPIVPYLPDLSNGGGKLFALSPFESFTTRFKIAFWTSVCATSPMIIWQFLAFVLPALRDKERKWFLSTFFSSLFLFIFGVVFCYLVILDKAFGWLIEQSEGMGEVLPQMSLYIDMIIKFEIGFGIAFQIPLIVFFLVIFKIIPYKKLRSWWRYIYLALMIFSAVVTPDASPVTMLLLFTALIALYEVSLALASLIIRNKSNNNE